MSARRLAGKATRILLDGGLSTHIAVGLIVLIEVYSNDGFTDQRLFSALVVTVIVIFTEGRRRNKNKEKRYRAERNMVFAITGLMVAQGIWNLAQKDTTPIRNDSSLVVGSIALTMIMIVTWGMMSNRWVQDVICKGAGFLYGLIGKGERKDDAMSKSSKIALDTKKSQAAGRCVGASWVIGMVAILAIEVAIGTEGTATWAILISFGHNAFIGAIAIAIWDEPVVEKKTEASKQPVEKLA